jgi:hypothetical protein
MFLLKALLRHHCGGHWDYQARSVTGTNVKSSAGTVGSVRLKYTLQGAHDPVFHGGELARSS